MCAYMYTYICIVRVTASLTMMIVDWTGEATEGGCAARQTSKRILYSCSVTMGIERASRKKTDGVVGGHGHYSQTRLVDSMGDAG